ncbi:MAG: chemotaxis protein CheA [Nitrospirota bacterium]
MEEYPANLTDKELEALRTSFFAQAFEILELLGAEILKFEKNPEDIDILKNIQRYVHTLKGDSASMGLNSLSEAAHRLEDILNMLREKKLRMDRDISDILLLFVDVSTQILTNNREGNENTADTEGLIKRIDSYLNASDRDSPKKAAAQNAIPVLTEYQQLQVGQALKDGLSVYEIEAVFDPQCREREVGAFMVKTQLSNLGEAICWMPNIEGQEIEYADAVKIIFSSKSESEAVRNSCAIAGIIRDVSISLFSFTETGGGSCIQEHAGAGLRTAAGSHDSTLRVDAKRVDEIMNLVGELIIGRSMITQSVSELSGRLGRDEAVSNLENIDALFERTLSELQKGVMKIRMVPIDHVFRKFPRIIRDMSIEKEKEIKLDVSGADTELDKGIIDVIGEPMIHIIRNCIDHGIEKKEERESKGKDKCGVIKIKAYHEGGQIIIEIEDDGKGINTERVKEKAIEHGIISREDASNMDAEDSIDLIFHSGLSTAEEVTETSGRGIGMDAVKMRVEELKGLIQVKSVPDKGTKFTIRLPLTLAIIQGMVFKAGKEFFAFPLSSILEIKRVFNDEISTINGIESLRWRSKVISLIRLGEIIEHSSPYHSPTSDMGNLFSASPPYKSFALIIGLAEKRVGILVDKLMGKRELVIKAMDNGSNIVSGASILGDGSVVLILDVASLIKRIMVAA